MIERRSVVILAVLCALVFSAVAATSASAGPGRAWTCAPSPKTYEYLDAHCQTVGEGYGKAEILNNSTTKITATNQATTPETTAAEVESLKGKISGVATEIRCTTVTSSEGHLTNTAAFVSGAITFTYSGCTVARPAGRKCKVGNSGVITTEVLGWHTNGMTESNEITIEPVEKGGNLAKIKIEGCENNIPPEEEYPVTGTIIVNSLGATPFAEHAKTTSQGTLLFGGNTAGLQGALTARMEGAGGNPIILR